MAELPKFNPSLLSECHIKNLPSDFFYISHFVTPEEEAAIPEKLPPNRWVNLSHRRLQVHPSQLSASNVLLDAPLPAWLTTSPPIAQRFAELAIFGGTPHGRANHCLVNEYRPGEGIMPHEDGAAYAPIVATVSLGGATVLDLYEKRATAEAEDGGSEGLKRVTGIYQERGSLLVTMGEAYTSLLHGISSVVEDVGLGPETVANWGLLDAATRERILVNGDRNVRSTRTSLTFRDVLKVKKIGMGLVGRR